MLASLIRLAHPTARAASRSFASFARPNSSGLRPVNLRKPPPKRIDENTPEANLDCPETSSQLDNSLLSPVYIPEDPNGVLKSSHPAARLLDNSGLVVQRQLELGNLLLGFEQQNKYVIMDPNGNHVGFIAEEESGIAKIIARQWFRTHRAFTTHVFDKEEREVLRFHRPFSFIKSRIRVLDPINPTSTSHSTTVAPSKFKMIGECQQQWHLLRRKYNLFLYHDPVTASFSSGTGEQLGGGVFTQFAYVDEPMLSWDFSLLTASDELIGSVNRNFAGFGREILTDTGVYALRMDSASAAVEPKHLISNTHQGRRLRDSQGAVIQSGEARGMTLDERAVMLAAAVTIDFDYFSRHSHGGGLDFFPYYFGWGGGEDTDGVGSSRSAGDDSSLPPQDAGSQGGGSGGGGSGGGGSWGGKSEGASGGGGSGGGGSGGGDFWPWDD